MPLHPPTPDSSGLASLTRERHGLGQARPLARTMNARVARPASPRALPPGNSNLNRAALLLGLNQTTIPPPPGVLTSHLGSRPRTPRRNVPRAPTRPALVPLGLFGQSHVRSNILRWILPLRNNAYNINACSVIWPNACPPHRAPPICYVHPTHVFWVQLAGSRRVDPSMELISRHRIPPI